MNKWILLTALLLPVSGLTAETVHLHIKGDSQSEAMAAARKGYDYWNARGAREVAPASARRSSDKRKQSLYFPESFSGYLLSEENELLKISKGRVVQRMKVRPLQDKVLVRPEVDDEVLTGAEVDQKQGPIKKKKPHK